METDEEEDLYWNSFLPIFFDRMTSVMRKDMTEEVKEYGLTSAHSVYLIGLYLQNGSTLVRLSRLLDMDAANTTRVIRVLKEKGLVTDDRESEHSKKYHIFLTEEGEKLAKRVMDKTMECNNRYMSNLSREEILQVRNSLLKILRNMDPNLDEYMAYKYTNHFYTYLATRPGSTPFKKSRLDQD